MTTNITARARIRLLSCVALSAVLAACANSVEDGERVAPVAEGLGVSDPPIVISQVYGGGGNTSATFRNDFVELFNRSASTVVMTNWSVQYASATGTGNFSANPVTVINATLAPGQYLLVQASGGAVGAPLPAPDATGTVNMSATGGKVVLVNAAAGLACNGGSTACSAAQEAAIVDLVGYDGANYFEGAAAPSASATASVIRKDGGCIDSNDNAADFVLGTPPTPRNSATAPAPCGAPSVIATVPANGAANVDPDANIDVTFSEPVTVAGSWYALACTVSGNVSANASGGPTTYTLDPASSLVAAEHCTVTISAGGVTDLDGFHMNADAAFTFTIATPPTPIRTIQGAGHVSPLAGSTVTTRGIVTGVRSNGYYLQDPAPDDDDATSEAIFVFTSSAPAVAIGDDVIATGPVAEFRPGCSGSCTPSSSGFANLSNTEISRPNTSTVISRGNALPAPVVIGLGGRVPPDSAIENDSGNDVEVSNTFDPSEDGIDFYESLEDMRVQINDALAVGPSKLFGATSKEIYIVPDAGSGASLRTARGGVAVRATDFNPERIVLTNTILPALPDADVGDTLPGAIVGVIDYEFANYRIIPTTAVPAVQHNGLARESLALPALTAADLRIAAFNVENLDPLDPAAKLDELASIIVDELMSPDILTVEEIQDNDGPTNSGTVDATATFGTLIAAIASAGGPSYDFRSINPVDGQDGGEPGGNIRVGFLFRSDRGLSFVDKPGAGSLTANSVTSSGGVVGLQYSPGRIDPSNSAFSNSRKPLAAQFSFRGSDLFVIGNHFNSKGGDQPLFGRFQPPTLASEVQRLAQAHVVADFVAQILTADADANVVVLGDLNDFEFSAPVSVLEAAGLTTLIETLPAAERYTYVFEGNSQVLDHVLVSPHALGRVAGFDVVHVNAEFASQASDHDPGVAMLRLDTVAPVLSNPGPLVLEAASAAGVVATFAVTAEDDIDGPVAVSCTPASGSTFALGTSSVSCSASDQQGNVGTTSFTVRVQDTTPPLLSAVPADISATATSPAGAVVSYATPTASDLVSGRVPVSCAPASGSTFAIGTSSVSCRAQDDAGNTASATFTVAVAPQPHQLASSGPATMFLGLTNSDDQGTQFDLAVELLLDGAVVARAEQRCITGVTRNPNNAKQVALPFPAFTPVNVATGDTLALRVSTRIGTTATGAKCSGPGGSHGNTEGLRLYFDAASRPARADAVNITPGDATNLYLHATGKSRFLSSTAPTAPSAKTLDSCTLKLAGGNPWHEVGTFSTTVP